MTAPPSESMARVLEFALGAAAAVAVAWFAVARVPHLEGTLPILVVGGLVGALLASRVGHGTPPPTPVAAPADATVPLRRPVATPIPSPSLQSPPAVVPVKPATTVDWAPGQGTMLVIPKSGSTAEECEDAWMRSADGRIIAVSDGASSSFGAADWSKHLVQSFTSNPVFDEAQFADWVHAARAGIQQAPADQGAGGWWADEGNRRGAFATLLGIRLDASTRGQMDWHAIAVGDSCIFHLRSGSASPVVASFPVSPGESFGSYPDLVASTAEHAVPRPRLASGRVRRGDVIILATDAVSEWAMTDMERLVALATLDSQNLSRLLVDERAAGNIVNDDLTVVRVPFVRGGR